MPKSGVQWNGLMVMAHSELSQMGKKILFYVLQVYDFPFFIYNYQLLSTNISYKSYLRVRAFFHKTVPVCHVWCNFNIGFMCRITVIFGTLKDGSRLINTLASNICFSYRNMFPRGGTRIIFWRGVRPEVWNPYPYLRIFLPQKTADLKLFFEIFANQDPFLRVFYLTMADFTIFSRFLRNGTLF